MPTKKFWTVATAASLIVMTGFITVRGFADEGIPQIAVNVQQKQRALDYLREQRNRHQAMDSSEQIMADFASAFAHNRDGYVRSGVAPVQFDQVTGIALQALRTIGDKDALVAMETLQIQRQMESSNMIFGITRSAFDSCKAVRSHPSSVCYTGNCDEWWLGGEVRSEPFTNGPCAAVMSFMALLTIPLDIVVLPFEFIGSALSGF